MSRSTSASACALLSLVALAAGCSGAGAGTDNAPESTGTSADSLSINSSYIHINDNPRIIVEPISIARGGVILATPSGKAHLQAAAGRWFTSDSAAEHGPVGPEQKTCREIIDNGGGATSCPGGGGYASYVECTTQDWKDKDIVALADRVALVSDPNVYPGALLQGGYLQGGAFTPITIARSGGTIFMTGVNMQSPTIKISEVSASNVRQAQQTLVGRTQGSIPNAVFSMTSQTVRSFDELLINLGVHAKWPSGNLKAKFDLDKSRKLSHVLVKFTQRAYDLNFEAPVTADSVFRDGSNFDDPQNQIGPGNRPTYVSKVTYGRQLLLLVSSDYSSELVKASLDATIMGQSGNLGATHKKVLDGSSFTYVVYGGDMASAAIPLQNIGSGESPEVAIKKAVSTMQGLSNITAAEPIGYSITDLITNQPAQVGYSIVDKRQSCRTVPQREFKFAFRVNKVDDDVVVWVDEETESQRALHLRQIDPARASWGWSDARTESLNELIGSLGKSPTTGGQTGRRAKLIIKHGNGGCFEAYGDFELLRDGVPVWSYKRPAGGWSHCGWQSDSQLIVDLDSGNVTVTKNQ